MMTVPGVRHTGAARCLEMWGGVECTVNRVGNQHFDQMERSSHRTRLEDIDRFADLGLHALRFPLLWEHMQPDQHTTSSWDWPDRALSLLRRNAIRPILGLLHHGYGPSWSGLLEPEFPEHFARYASLVARRYPWVNAYTPVNEPLTTARFSGLYGHWYPHERDTQTFARIFLAQCRATVLAMHAIRSVNPEAKLIQTEDLGKTGSTPLLAYQRDFENERRWLTWDILHGSVDSSHPMWRYFRSVGIPEHDLAYFLDSPCPPDVIGVNYYVTSERFLDDRIERYDPASTGGNGRDTYTDVATVHALDESTYPHSHSSPHRIGVGGVLREAWNRYKCTLAVTECHIGCTREEQMRWLHETWTAAAILREDGVNIQAVTTWALLGSYDWNSLVTEPLGCYESGAFDVRAPVPRPTAVAHMVRSLALTGAYTHPVLNTPGWWHRSVDPLQISGQRAAPVSSPSVDVLILGTTEPLGRTLADMCVSRGLSCRLTGRPYIDIADQNVVRQTLAHYRPWLVINTAEYADVDRAEADRARCTRENTLGSATLAAVCAARGIRLVTYSSDLVFDGQKGSAYVESDVTHPCTVYGHTKATGERLVLEIAPQSLVIRAGAFFGPLASHDLLSQAIQALRTGREFEVPDNIMVTPTYVPDLAHATLDLALDGEQGLWHLSNGVAMTWARLIQTIAERLKLSMASLMTLPAQSMGFVAPRPANSALSSELGWIMPTLEDALTRYVNEVTEHAARDSHIDSTAGLEACPVDPDMVDEQDQRGTLTYQ